jgi:hypothetical protein
VIAFKKHTDDVQTCGFVCGVVDFLSIVQHTEFFMFKPIEVTSLTFSTQNSFVIVAVQVYDALFTADYFEHGISPYEK